MTILEIMFKKLGYEIKAKDQMYYEGKFGIGN